MTTYIDREISNADYHAQPGSFSSSNLKVALEDMEMFYKDKILGQAGERFHIPAFDTGTYFHTRVLEPHLLDKDCIVFPGKVRRGKAWDDFSSIHKDKAILNEKQKQVAENLAKLVFDSPCAMKLLDQGEPEISVFAELFVDWETNTIYSGDLCQRLTKDGWEFIDFDEEIQPSITSQRIKVKVRSDSLIESEGAILDLKSTNGNCKNHFEVKKKITKYEYDLSASMYLDVFSLAYAKPFTKFYWTFASKDKDNCKTYLASHSNVRIGRAKWTKAILAIAENMSKGWKFEDTVEILEPESYVRMEWLEKED